ncbi:MAG: V-type ATP synthase subunit D [Clostridia bacterium]|nr:V-type ATP synthase subunit D [Clostridia bacterium]
MAELKITPTRMEQKKLKLRLEMSRRGHRLLSNKRDELMRQFIETVREAKKLREVLSSEAEILDNSFIAAAAVSDPKIMIESLMLPSAMGELKVKRKSIMSVEVPVFSYDIKALSSIPYGFAFTSGELDEAISYVASVATRLIKLAELESCAMLLCEEIEKTRRRVNALEHIMIPQYENALRRIAMKLDENERASATRLMKVKDMIIKASR